jgi:hypothetical protein
MRAKNSGRVLRASVAPVLVLAAVFLAPSSASGQFGAVEALASRVSDLGFFYSLGGIQSSRTLQGDALGVKSFGVELLFEVAEIPSGAARERVAGTGSEESWVLRETRVTVTDAGTDTSYHYDVVRRSPSYGPDDIAWTLELGIGYGQVQGLELRDAELDLNATIRTLPSLTLYLTYEPLGAYLGLRTGFLRTHAMQVRDGSGTLFDGDAEAFMMGGLGGYARSLGPTWLFLEVGYTERGFPSVEWSAPASLPAGVPRELDVSGWGITAGLQFPIR